MNMSLKNNSIRNYFKTSSQIRKTPAVEGAEWKGSASVDSIVGETTDGDHTERQQSGSGEIRNEANLELSGSLEVDADPRSSAAQSSRDRVINGSDEDSDSDSSLEDIYEALQHQSRSKHTNSAANGFESKDISRTRNKRKRMLIQVSPARPKYKFDMKSLIQQADEHKATEESALSMKALLEDNVEDELQGDNPDIALDNILQSVLAEKEKEGDAQGKLLMAVKRTEAIRSETACYFFDFTKASSRTVLKFPASIGNAGWKALFADPASREQALLSGFVRDMVNLEDALDHDLFQWMLNEICLECRDDLRDAYFGVLTTVGEQVKEFMSLDTITGLFRNIGVREAAFNINEKLQLTPKVHAPYAGHDWTPQRAVITFIGRVSRSLSMEVSYYVVCLLNRLCVDTVVLEDTSLLATIQKTMEQLCDSVEDRNWETTCQKICASIFCATSLPILQLQVLLCIPQTTQRVHELRRRLALAFFYEDIKYASGAPQDTLDLSKVVEALMKPKFTISKQTDYVELAAIMSILNIAIDNGLSFSHDVTNLEGEMKFNREVDILTARIKRIWGTINDAGAAFLSRSYAKEMMEGLRMRLELTIRTRPKPKLSIFETDEPDEDQVLLKQTTISRKLFQKKILDEGMV